MKVKIWAGVYLFLWVSTVALCLKSNLYVLLIVLVVGWWRNVDIFIWDAKFLILILGVLFAVCLTVLTPIDKQIETSLKGILNTKWSIPVLPLVFLSIIALHEQFKKKK